MIGILSSFVALQGTLPKPISAQNWGGIFPVLAVVGGAAVFVVILWIAIRRHNKKGWITAGGAVGAEEIFNRLCQANELSRIEIYLLRKLIHDLKLNNVVMPFVDPEVYDRLKPSLSAPKQALLLNIKEKLFA